MTNYTPCNQDRVIEYVRGRFSATQADAFARHQRFCRGCRLAVEHWQSIVEAVRSELRDPFVLVQPPRTTTLASFRARAQESQRAARQEVIALLSAPASRWELMVAQRPELEHAAVIRSLLSAADNAFESTPSRCREICALAARIADRISMHGMVPLPELRIEAYKDLANINRRLGDFAEAMRCLDIAAGIADSAVEPEYQHAIVGFARSLVLTDMQQWSAAASLLHAARSVFEDADRRRYVLTFHQEAIIQSLTGDFDAAAATVTDVIDQVAGWDDADELAHLFTVASFAWEGAGDFDAASDYAARAMALHTRAGHIVELARDAWRLGWLALKAGRYETGFAQIERARPMLLQCGLTNDALALDFDVLEARIAEGSSSPEQIAALCRQIVNTSAALPVNAAHALAWLRDAAMLLDRDTVKHIRAFVTDSQVYRTVDFVPPFEINKFHQGTVGIES